MGRPVSLLPRPRWDRAVPRKDRLNICLACTEPSLVSYLPVNFFHQVRHAGEFIGYPLAGTAQACKIQGITYRFTFFFKIEQDSSAILGLKPAPQRSKCRQITMSSYSTGDKSSGFASRSS